MGHTMPHLKPYPLLAILFTWLLAGCRVSQNTPNVVPSSPSLISTPNSTHTPSDSNLAATGAPTQPGARLTPEPTTALVPGGSEPLLPEPQHINFQAADGVVLSGTYYPASSNPAPLVLLAHWAGGDQEDWFYLGLTAWLQNRGQIPYEPARAYPFDTPYIFPELPHGLSLAVFTFDFRNFGQSQFVEASQADLYRMWLLDAQAALALARQLPGIDPTRVAAVGASIGADAMVDACRETCLGVISLSPGSYLGIQYELAVQHLDQVGVPVWCLAAEDDPLSAITCQNVSGKHFTTQIYPKGGHAMELFQERKNLQPSLGQVILNALLQIFGQAR